MELKKISEFYPNIKKNYSCLNLSEEMERGKNSDSSWGSALSLSLEETLEYCQKQNSFVPSAGLFFSIMKTTIDKKTLLDLDNYWHRTSTIIVFPTKSKGYILHYPKIKNGKLVRKNGIIEAEITIPLEKQEIPKYGTIATIKEYPKFFEKLLGKHKNKKYNTEINLWIPTKKCVLESPERLVIFGGFIQYGMGIWLTSNSKDKTLVGKRPFKTAQLKK